MKVASVGLAVAVILVLGCNKSAKRDEDGDTTTTPDVEDEDVGMDVPTEVEPDTEPPDGIDVPTEVEDVPEDPAGDDVVGMPCTSDEDCEDGLFCNGEEFCHPAGECRRAPAPDCSDGDDCTTDSCVEETDSCDHVLIDGDSDTYPPESCGGPDCDDTDAAINPGATEICGDGIDQDCDGVDESDGDCTCPHYLTLPAEWSGDTGASGLGDTETGSCVTTDGAPEAVHRFDLSAGAEVMFTISTERWYDAVVYIRETTCTGTEVGCFTESELPDRLTLSAGTYFVFVDGEDPGEDGRYWLGVTTCEAPGTTVTGNDDCSSAHSLTADGSYGGDNTSLTDTADPSTCAGWSGGGHDAWFTFTLSASSAVHLDTNCSDYDTVLYIYDGSCSGSEIECDDDGGIGGASQIDATLPAGTYYVALDGYYDTSVGAYVLNISGL
jgi:hypothetical protein